MTRMEIVTKYVSRKFWLAAASLAVTTILLMLHLLSGDHYVKVFEFAIGPYLIAQGAVDFAAAFKSGKAS